MTAVVFAARYGVRQQGNALSDPTGEFTGKNILFQDTSLEAVAKKTGKTVNEVRQLLGQAKQKLFAVREQRPRPHLDDKILTDWNGLMISALALGSRVLDEPEYRSAAEQAARFILDTLWVDSATTGGKQLLRRYRDKSAAIPGTLDDYAFFINGLVDLYQATFDPAWLAAAKTLTEQMNELFWDSASGGFFITGSDAEQLLVRQKELYDGAIPSGNSMAALALLRVGRLTQSTELEQRAQTLFGTFGQVVQPRPSAYSQLLIALDFAIGPSREIVLAGDPAAPASLEMVKTIYKTFLPNMVVAFHPEGEEGQAIEALAPYLKFQTAQEGKTTAYVCENYACRMPVTDTGRLSELLK